MMNVLKINREMIIENMLIQIEFVNSKKKKSCYFPVFYLILLQYCWVIVRLARCDTCVPNRIRISNL